MNGATGGTQAAVRVAHRSRRRSAARAIGPGASGCTRSGTRILVIAGMTTRKSASVTASPLGDASQQAKPTTPASTIRASSAALPGTMPPHRPMST